MYQASYIKSFSVVDIANVNVVNVQLGEKRTHLIITGRNGSGKTSILRAIHDELVEIRKTNGNIHTLRVAKEKAESAYQKSATAESINLREMYNSFSPARVALELSGTGFADKKDIFIFFSANRALDPKVPTSITTYTLSTENGSVPEVNKLILQHLVNLKAQRAFARDEGDDNSVELIDKWFNSFEGALREIFESSSVALQFNRQALNFVIVDGNKRYGFNTLSSGQSAILNIYAELLLRVDAAANGNMEIGGVILIDEPENHLHASLQKKVLAFLVQSFPQFQFIVTTHSPFILTSLQDASILNLEDGKVYYDFSKFSYEAVLEEYMLVDKYSHDVKLQIANIKNLIAKNIKSEAMQLLEELLLNLEVSGFSLDTSSELALEIRALKLKSHLQNWSRV
jgi:predicted ATP-dependent endonuclease of OLD family